MPPKANIPAQPPRARQQTAGQNNRSDLVCPIPFWPSDTQSVEPPRYQWAKQIVSQQIAGGNRHQPTTGISVAIGRVKRIVFSSEHCACFKPIGIHRRWHNDNLTSTSAQSSRGGQRDALRNTIPRKTIDATRGRPQHWLVIEHSAPQTDRARSRNQPDLSLHSIVGQDRRTDPIRRVFFRGA